MDAIKTNEETPLEYKKKQYLEKKESLQNHLQKLIDILKKVENKPLTAKDRQQFMMKFSTIDHRILDRFDIASLEYYEELNKTN